MRRQSIIYPHLSSYTYIFEIFDYNPIKLSPPGTIVVIHNRQNNRASWAPHGEDGWWIRPAMEYYIWHKTYISQKRAEWISDTVEFKPKQFNIPEFSYIHAIIHAAHDLFNTLQNPESARPLSTLVNVHKKLLISIVEIFGKVTPPGIPPKVPVRGAYQEKLQQVN